MAQSRAMPTDEDAPAYTFVMPAFNAEATLSRAVESVLAQTYPSWRLIVIDDGSTDTTGQIAAGYAQTDARISAISRPNTGVATARNEAVAAATTQFVSFVDADDELDPEYLASMDAFIESNPGYEIYHPNVRIQGVSATTLFSDRTDVGSVGFAELLEECVIALGGAIVSTALFERLGGFRTDIWCEDYDFWLRATAQGMQALYVPDPLYVYHQDLAGRRSEDAVSGVEDSIRSLESLMAEGAVEPESREAVTRAIDDKRHLLLEVRRHQERQRQADRVTGAVEGVLGSKASKPVLGALRGVGTVVRPVRNAMAGARVTAAEKDSHARRLRVLVVPSWYPSEARPTAGVFIAQQVSALSAVCDVAVLHVDASGPSSPPELTTEDGVRVVRARVEPGPRSQIVDVGRVGMLAFDALREQWGVPDIVHVQALWPAASTARRIKRRYGIPYVVTEHSEEYLPQSARRLVRTPGVVGLLLRPLARGASRTIAVSSVLANRLAELGLAVRPVVIPNVAAVSDPSPLPLAPPHAIAHVSIMGPAKNLGSLLKAVDKLRARRSDFILRLVGDGECRAELEARSANLGLGDLVEFTGRKSAEEVRAILATSAFTVVSSTHETFSVSAAESLMSGRPVVSTRCGGPEEFITPEVGRLVAVGDVDALADGLDWMLDHFTEFDPEALHEYARERFAPEVVAARIVEVYREALDG